MGSSLLSASRRVVTSPLGLLALLGMYVAVVEMRPGRLYYILNFLLFRDSLAHFLLFLLCLGISLAGVLSLLLNRNKPLYWATLLLWFPCLVVSLTYRFIIGYNFMHSDAVLAWNNRSLAGSALENYAPLVAAAILASVVVLALLHLLRKKIKWRAAPAMALAFPLAAVAVYTHITWTTGVVDDFPALYRVPLNFGAAIAGQVPQPAREPVPVSPATAGVPHLFLIMDESITATELSLNHPQKKTTPFLASLQDHLYNYGVASATVNQSAGSNMALMSGTRLSELPDTAFRTLSRTNIFQFAQKAGYKTYYIDAQLGADVLQNFMSPEDLKYIDSLLRPAALHPALPYYERDMWVAEYLVRLAKQPERIFAYVVKAGAHWPYARTYPADSAFFQPTLTQRSLYKDRTRTLNTYHNALRWTVDAFWRKLTTNISGRDSTVIVYTSDHGQNLTEAGISIAHASVQDTSPQEVAVPLWVWDPAQISSLPPPQKQGYSHFHIFPTLLQLQGYAPSWVQTRYGSSLYDRVSPAAPRLFLAGDLFGRGPHSLQRFVWPLKAGK
ncbi:sulfatase-like hydrolase/transferase [Rufibacter ruber]|uniref:sulfatase-like hydrolase/transferase n=1 Tax=Rufibacter ruber TaxID=1783499 RepID=UPI0009ED18D3|nr:sulfatase-like hydrolase/transferase [Rufibacter ruber]